MSITLAEVLEENPINVNLLLSGVSAGEAGAVLLQQHITKTSKLQILELRGSNVGSSGCSRLARALHEHPCIRHIGLARNGLDMPSCVELINALSTCRMLQSLDLEWNSIDDQCATVLSKWLSQLDCTLVALNLERNFITKNGAMNLAKAISNNSSLKNLNIGHMRCETEGAAEWGKMLSVNKTLSTLNLSGSELLTDGTKHILVGLRENSSIRALSLQYCQGLTAISELAGDMRFDMTLKELNLQGSRAAPNEAGGKGFAMAIQKATGLLGLNISRCVISDAAMTQMLHGISLIMSLQVFDVSSCGLSDESMGAMSQLLDRCINLHTLSMDDNHLGPRGGQILAEGLGKAASLVSLSISNCDLRNSGTLALTQALKKNHLASLKVSNNGFDIDGGKALIQALLEDPRYTILKELDISHNRLTARFSALLGLLFKRHPSLMPICVRGTTISAAVQEAYVDATSIRLSAEAQRKNEKELMNDRNNSPNFSSPARRGDPNHHFLDGEGEGDGTTEDLSMLLNSTVDNLDLSGSYNNVHHHHHQNENNCQNYQQQQQQQALVTNFHGATPQSRSLPPHLRTQPNAVTQKAIQQHKEKGSWIDHEFGETVNNILNSTTNFRTSRTVFEGSDNKNQQKHRKNSNNNNNKVSTVEQNELSQSPNRLKRAEALAGAISSSGATGTYGYGESYKLSSLDNNSNKNTNNMNQKKSDTSNNGASLSRFDNQIGAGGGDGTNDNGNGNNHDGEVIVPSAALRALDSLTSHNMTSTKQSPISRHQAAKELLVKNHSNAPSAGGFLYTAGLAPRTEPSPMWARRPQIFDIEACVGESLCVSEPQLKLAFMELDRERTGLVSRKDVDEVYKKFCVDFDPILDTKKLDNFFIKYASGGGGAGNNTYNSKDSSSANRKIGKINYDAFCMLMLSLVNR